MNSSPNSQTADAKSVRKLTTTSKDGKWKTFHAAPGLMQYVPSGIFYARTTVHGKILKRSLETDVFSTAKLKLQDKLKELRKPKTLAGTFGDGRLKYEAESSNGYTSKKRRFIKLAPRSTEYRLRCLECLRRTLVEVKFHPSKTWKLLTDLEQKNGLAKLDAMNAREFTKEVCDLWQTAFAAYSPTVFNNTVNTFRRILELAGIPHDENLAYEIGRRDIMEKPIDLPRPDQFDRIIQIPSTPEQSPQTPEFARHRRQL